MGRRAVFVASISLAFLLSARRVGRDHLVTPTREVWQPLRAEGFGATRVASRAVREAIVSHFDPERRTWTKKALDRLD